MIVEMVTVGPFMENAFVVGCPETKEAVVIDPGTDAPKILEAVEKHGLKVIKIINTHAHIDHLGAVQDVKDATGAGFYLHEAEVPLAEAYDQQCQMFGVRFGREPEVDGTISEGEKIKVGNLEADTLLTPGHSPGGLCFNFGEHVFVGDSLFMGSIGRTDLPGGNYETLISNIKQKLLVLPPETVAHCGHGPDTTIGREKDSNPFLTGRMNIF